MTDSRIPLCVDLDGTLLKTDLLWESLFALAKTAPWKLFAVFAALVRGKAAFKAALAMQVMPEVSSLPVNQVLVDKLLVERAGGRRLILATASPRPWAEGVATRVGLFDEVIATELVGGPNLAGSNKAARLTERFGERGFDYAGNSSADLPVWKHANAAWVVAASASLEQRARAVAQVQEVISEGRPRPKAFFKAMRPHQWAKNVLVFLPLLTAHLWSSVPAVIDALLAFVAFSLAASATYLLNDLLDLPSDRQHPRKCRRPFASGAASLSWGAVGLPGLLVAAGIVSLWLPIEFVGALGVYVIATVAYSLVFKRQPILDALVLAGLYTLRIFAGGTAGSVPISGWLLAFSVFLFLSLAFAKRYAELVVMLASDRRKAAGRGYTTDDLPLVQTLGVSAGYISVLVLALYFNSPAARLLYEQTRPLGILCPILLWWISRVWMLTHRGQMEDDPVVFALKDRASYVAGVLGVVAMLIAK